MKIIKTARLTLGLTQQELARKLGYKIPQFVSLMENGHSKVPSDVAKAIVNFLKKSNQQVIAYKLVKDINENLVASYWGKS